MCGIVASVSNRNIVPLLVQGLQRLEYRGYDSCGVAVHRMVSGSPISQGLERTRSTARVAQLLAQVQTEDFQGHAWRTGGGQRPPAL
jgi:glutamine---fructose-6-phosphate transaminase (isomerizing)